MKTGSWTVLEILLGALGVYYVAAGATAMRTGSMPAWMVIRDPNREMVGWRLLLSGVGCCSAVAGTYLITIGLGIIGGLILAVGLSAISAAFIYRQRAPRIDR